jgi:hypothetical protein
MDPYQTVRWQQERKQLYSLSTPTVSYKMFCTIMKSAVLHNVAGPCQAVRWQQERKYLCSLSASTASYKVFLNSHRKDPRNVSSAAATFSESTNIKSHSPIKTLRGYNYILNGSQKNMATSFTVASDPPGWGGIATHSLKSNALKIRDNGRVHHMNITLYTDHCL